MPRALTNEERIKKENFILDNAKKMFENKNFRSFRMEDLAKECSLSKGILFKYFKSKEMLFLSLLEKEYEKNFVMLDDDVKHHAEMTLVEFKEYVLSNYSKSLSDDSLYLRLLGIKNAILDDNQDYDFALKMNSHFHDLLLEYAQNILLKVRGITMEKINNLFQYQLVITIGYLNMSRKSSVVQAVIEDGKLDMLKVDYKELAIKGMKCYLDNEL